MRLLLIASLIATFTVTACSVNKRDPKTPPPTIEKVRTDFFFKFSKDRKTYKPRRFLFGMSAEDKTGHFRDFAMDHWNTFGSSNVEFDFNEEGDKLIGRLVNPTYPNNRSKWKILLTFNIARSYYEENRVDATGRESNDRIQRTDRSDPKARPFIDLDLSSMNVYKFRGIGVGALITSMVTQRVYDVEWDEENGFLGFSTTSVSSALGGELQREDRINLMRIEPSDPNFEVTHYHKDNDKYTQIIDIISERPNHYGERLKAVHWDINSKTKKKHKIYIHNFPKEYVQTAIDSIESWNDVFEKSEKEGGIGMGYRPFSYEVSKRKYAFDLRYHTIHWVDDIRLSAAGPLGLANMASDITNGKVLWTGSIIWGGLLDNYVASYIPSFAVTGDSSSGLHQLDISHTLPKEHNQTKDTEQINSNTYSTEYPELNLTPITWPGILKEVGLEPPKEQGEINLGYIDINSTLYKTLPKPLVERMANDIATSFSSHSFDADNHIIDRLHDLNLAIGEMMDSDDVIDIFEVKKVAIRKTITHEIGHTLGLAHNFKSNILPEKGDVPNSIYNDLAKKAKEGMTNKSSIMGYPDGRTVVRTKYEDMVPGPNDVSRIRFLYRQQYPMYNKKSKGESNYVWKDLDEDGRIRPQITVKGEKHTPGFLPGCNDVEASYYMDPYCNRHDRGYNAETLVENYFDRYEDSLFRLLQSNIDSLKNRNYKGLEMFLWDATSRLLTRTRLFYDYMRRNYAKDIQKLRKKNIFETYKSLLNFSKSCRMLIGKDSDELSSLRSSDPDLKTFIKKEVDGSYKTSEFGDLCIATAKYFDRIAKLLEIEGKEYTEIDYLNRTVPGGMRSGDVSTDYSRMFGSWKRLTILPLKFKIMQNVMTPRAMMSTRYGDYLLYPYGRPDTSFSLATLFPEEYLKTIRLLAEQAMQIDDPNSEPRISRSLLYLGYFSRMQNYTADWEKFPKDILEAVFAQTQFRYSPAYISIEANKVDGTDFAKAFKGTISNRFNSNGSESLGPVYLYTLDRFVFKSQVSSLALPVTPIRWRTSSSGYSAAIKLDYAPNIHFEELDSYSPRNYFIDYYKRALEQCVKGDEIRGDNGLASFFKASSDYEGIEIPYDIQERTTALKELNESIKFNLDKFSKEKNFDLNNCENALRSQRALVLGASLMNGYYFQETDKYIEQGSN